MGSPRSTSHSLVRGVPEPLELGSTAMSYADAKLFMVDKSTFPTDTTQCRYHLETHSIMVDLMMGEAAPFAVACQQCKQDLHSHFDLSLQVYYGELGGGAYYQVRLHILYWIMQQFLYYLSERKFGQHLPLPNFLGLLCHMHTKTLNGFLLGHLPTSWLKQIHPIAHAPTNWDTMTPSWEPHATQEN